MLLLGPQGRRQLAPFMASAQIGPPADRAGEPGTLEEYSLKAMRQSKASGFVLELQGAAGRLAR